MRLLSKSPEETLEIGIKIGRTLKEGDTIALFGELGSGKTILVKGIASHFSVPEKDITSASFTIISEHKATIKDKNQTIPFYHIDLYRLENSDIDFLGLEEYIGRGICVIEWAERLGKIHEDFIRVNLTIIDAEKREIIIEGINEEDWYNR